MKAKETLLILSITDVTVKSTTNCKLYDNLTMQNMKTKIILFFAMLFFCGSYAQTPIFSENMGTPGGTTAITSNTFQNSGSLVYSNGAQTNPADVRATSTSTGYSGASGGGNVYFTSTSGTYGFSIEGINASNYTTLSVQFGYKKESASSHAGFSVDYWNGSSWSTLANTASALFNEAANASAVWYLSKSLSIPSDANINGLKLRFVKTGTIAIRIDDVKLTGTETAPAVTNTTVAGITQDSATFAGNVTATGGSAITATGTVYSITAANGNPILGGSGVTTLATPSPNSGTGTFSNGSGTALSPNVQYSYNAYATKTTGLSGYGTVASFYTLAATPAAPVVNSPSGTSLHVSIGSDTNSSATTYAIQETTTTDYVQSDGSLGASAVYQTAAAWGTKTVIGLSPTTTYTFQVVAKNGDNISTSAGPTASGTTLVVPGVSTSGTLSALSTTYGTASSFTSFTVSGSNLTDNLVISAPNGFEISKTPSGTTGYAATQTLTPTSGTVSSTTIYVRLANITPFGTYSGNVTVVSTNDVITVNVPIVSSSVAKLGLTITGVTASNKTYDGNTNAALGGTASLNGVISSDNGNVTLVTASASASFADAAIGTGKAVTVAGYSLSGPSSGNYSLTQPTGLTADITSNENSDIVFNIGSSTSTNSDIDYHLYQGASISNTGSANGGSAGVMGFYLRDGGAGLNDADNLGTQLTAITFTVTNSGILRSARLFQGNSPRGATVTVSGPQIVFTGISDISVADDNQLALNLRVTFQDVVADNTQLQFAISSVAAASAGSLFAAANGGGASSSTSGNVNRIEVTADRLAFSTSPPSNIYQGVAITPSPEVEATDALGNTDTDYSGAISITASGGTLANSPQVENANSGTAAFANLIITTAGSGVQLSASAAGLTGASSSNFTSSPLATPIFDPVPSICSGGSLSPLPTTSNAPDFIVGSWSPALNNTATTIYTFTPNPGQNATTTTLMITVNSTGPAIFTPVGPIYQGGSLAALPTTSNNGVTGTWSPSLNNMATTTYTFTPNSGQCGTGSTLTIVVNTITDNTTLTQNYIKTTMYREPGSNVPVSSITYFDGLGRPMQQIAGRQSNTGMDIVTHIGYDAYGRQEFDYLPYASSQSNLSYIDRSGLPADVATQYQTLYGDLNPFGQKQFEQSPLNRVKKQAAPGNDWALGAGHEIKYRYETNIANDVKLYTATANITANTVTLGNGGGTVFYASGELYKVVTVDENNFDSEEFKDREGHMIMKRVFGTSLVNGTAVTEWHETYYVYDQFGNLSFVIPPMVTNATGQLADLCYQYKYDIRNRLIEKKLPGKDWEFMVYDKLDRVVATGPAQSPFSDLQGTDGWLITKYDDLNRVTYTGWENASVSSSARAGKQTIQDGATILSETKLTSSSTFDNIAISYSNNVLPNSFKLLTVTYYDNYDFPNAPNNFAAVEGQNVYDNSTNKPKGLITGKWERVLLTSSSTAAESSYTLYDYKGRAVRQYTQNYLGGFTQTDTNLEEMTGRVNYTVTPHSYNSNVATITVREDFGYDLQDRLLYQTHQINNGVVNLIAKNEYDDFGKLLHEHVGGTDVSNFTGLQKADYQYNIRGWMTGVNIDGITNSQLNSSENDLFAYKINYNDVQNETNYTGVKLYNGNISETYWLTPNSTSGNPKKYGYFYDQLNRLTNAVYQEPGNIAVVTGAYNENLGYDKNGNIRNLQRFTYDANMTNIMQIDDLTYDYLNNYSSNRLDRVTEGTNGNNQAGFIDANPTSTIDYLYDNYGNLIKDENKQITGSGSNSLTYNHLNLPTKITFASADTIEYIYNAEGKKNTKIVTQGSTVIIINYFDGFQYMNGALQFFPTKQGYVKDNGTSFNYVYNYTDHLGNIRLSYSDLNLDQSIASTEILEENHYYPFGLKQVPNMGANNQPDYKYKYNGKEFQDELGLNMYDYGARNYDPALGRFMNIDPHSENHYASSPYVYAYNNPNIFIDPDGKDGIVSGSGTKEDPYVVTANYYYYGLNKDQIAGVNSAIAAYNNDGKAFSFKAGDTEMFVQFKLTATEVADADIANEKALGDNVEIGDKTVRFGNVINNGTVEGENHLGEAGKKLITLDQQKTENLQKNAPGASLSDIYKGTMIHEIGHNLGANHNDPGSIMNYTYASERTNPNVAYGNKGTGVFSYSMSSVNSNGIRAIMGRMGQTQGPVMSTYGITNSIYLTPKENAKISEGSVGRLTLIQNQ
jgi:RHS repeat-associated protein